MPADRRPDAVRPMPLRTVTAAGLARIIELAAESALARDPPARIVPALTEGNLCRPRVLLPQAQIGRIPGEPAVTGSAGGFVHCRSGDYGLQPRRRGPLPRVAVAITAGQGGGMPVLRGRDADANLV